MHPQLFLWPVLIRSASVLSQSAISPSVKITPRPNTIMTSQNVISSKYSTLYEQEEVIEQFIYEAHETALSPEQSSKWNVKFPALNSAYDANITSKLASVIPASATSIWNGVSGDGAIPDIVDLWPNLSAQSWYSELLDVEIQGKEDVITAFEDIFSQTLSGAGFVTTTETDAHTTTTYLIPIVVTITGAPTTTPTVTPVNFSGRSAMPSSEASDTVSHASPTPISTPQVKPLTSSQKIGIGIGVGLALPLLLFAGIMAFILSRRRKHQKKQKIHEGVLPSHLESSGKAGGGVIEKSELDANNNTRRHHAIEKPELDSEYSRTELEAHTQIHEVDDGTSRFELEKNLLQYEARMNYLYELDG